MERKIIFATGNEHKMQEIRIIPHYAAIGIITLIQNELQMRHIPAHPPCIMQKGLPKGKHGCWIGAAAGLQKLELM